jgi:hypothetical protein
MQEAKQKKRGEAGAGRESAKTAEAQVNLEAK